MVEVFPLNKTYDCPACNCNNRNYRKEDGSLYLKDNFRGCLGKKSFFGKQLCPNAPHVHVKCSVCHLTYTMWSQEY